MSLDNSVHGLFPSPLSWLEFIGVLTTSICTIYFVPQLVETVYTLWIAPAIGKSADFLRMGSWAVITGASSGIGKAYAEELAKRGLNVVLIGRNKSKLDAVATDIEKHFSVQTHVVIVDFSQGHGVYDTIREQIEGLEVGTLVNNVGISYFVPNRLTEIEIDGGDEFVKSILHCNIIALTMMTRMILPQMVSRQKGIIINIGSITGLLPCPSLSLYSASKAYVHSFSQSLSTEYAKDGIIIQTLIPGFIVTDMTQHVFKPSLISLTPSDFVQRALVTVGIEETSAVYSIHRIWQLCPLEFLQRRLVETLSFLFPQLCLRLLELFRRWYRGRCQHAINIGDTSSIKISAAEFEALKKNI